MIASQQLQAIVEGALMAASEPLTVKRLMSLWDEDDRPESAQFTEALNAIAEACKERGYELKEVASGWRFQVREELAPWVNRLWDEKPQKYSRASLETLALIAYRQPITRGDIEEIRGVAVSSHIIRTLVEREWVKVVGQRDVPGRPSLYATTREFLDYFNLKSLDQLPTLSEIRDLDELNAELDLGTALELAATDELDADARSDDSQELSGNDAWPLDLAADTQAGDAQIGDAQVGDAMAAASLGTDAGQDEPLNGDQSDTPIAPHTTVEHATNHADSPATQSLPASDDETEASPESDIIDHQERDREI